MNMNIFNVKEWPELGSNSTERSASYRAQLRKILDVLGEEDFMLLRQYTDRFEMIVYSTILQGEGAANLD